MIIIHLALSYFQTDLIEFVALSDLYVCLCSYETGENKNLSTATNWATLALLLVV